MFFHRLQEDKTSNRYRTANFPLTVDSIMSFVLERARDFFRVNGISRKFCTGHGAMEMSFDSCLSPQLGYGNTEKGCLSLKTCTIRKVSRNTRPLSRFCSCP